MAVFACLNLGLLLMPPPAAALVWTPPVNLSTSAEFSPWEPRPEISMSGDGGGVAIWPHLDGLQNVEAASMSLAGSWGPPVKLAPSIYTQREPQVAMNEAGEAVAVWEQVEEQVAVVASVRTPSGEWGPPETLNPEGSIYSEIGVAVGPAGEAVAVWSELPRFGTTSGYRIEGSFRPAGGHWEPAATISETGHSSFSPRVAIGPSGQILVAWYGYLESPENQPRIQVSERQGEGWSQPQAISGGRNAAFPKVATSDAGATVIWQGKGGWIEAASRSVGGEWAEPVELSGPESFEPEIGVDATGTAVAIWSSFPGEGADYVEGSTLPAGGDWSEPIAVSGPVGLSEFTGARLAVAPSGKTLATWSVGRHLEPSVEERFVEEASGLEGTWEEPTTLSKVKTWAVRPAVALDSQGDGAVAWWAADPTLPQATEFVTPRGSAGSGGGGTSPSSRRSKMSRATARRVAFVRKDKAYLKLRCPGTSACKGDLQLIAPPGGENGKASRVSVRSVDFAIPAARERTVAVRLNPNGQQLFSAGEKKGIRVRLVGDQIQPRGLLLTATGNQARTGPSGLQN